MFLPYKSYSLAAAHAHEIVIYRAFYQTARLVEIPKYTDAVAEVLPQSKAPVSDSGVMGLSHQLKLSPLNMFRRPIVTRHDAR